MFKPVSSKVNFPQVEEQVLAFWKEHNIFRKSTEDRKDRDLFVLYEGPPTANGSPGIHHVLARVFKDVIPRFQTMKGYYAPRKGGWDTHGLPVELEVERELGISSKTQIEEYGVAQFNQRCRESVFRYLKDWEAMTDRIAFWVDMENPYITFDNSYVESCWWIIKQLWDRELVYQDYKVTPHCPRCGTSLSSHEVALGYKDDTPDPSVYVMFRLSGDIQPGFNAATEDALQKMGWDYDQHRWTALRPSLLAWTTTPWTLTANQAVAVSPDETYVLVEARGPKGVVERLILAKALLESALGNGEGEIITEVSGEALAGVYYDPLYKTSRQDWHQVLLGDFVSTKEGTGIVHIAPAYGEVDLELGRANGLSPVHTIDLQGRVNPEPSLPGAGRFVKDADALILDDLEQRGLLYRSGTIRHTYPFCWRCDSPLLYYAKSSWYIKTTAFKERLIAGNQQINWYPEHIKSGRFGDWLENNVDWAVSRERYWGTPLPVWRCENCGEYDCVGSVAELMAKPGYQGPAGGLNDLHRPFVDEATFECKRCSGTMRRLPEVLDAWFDSGAMPLAQWHYPFENEAVFNRFFPADYICEAVDQTRGWFYTLHALSTLLFGEPCFKNVICLGHILDAKGEKMSKSRGNVVEPWSVLNQYGADALRWYLYTASPAGNPRRFSAELVGESLRKFLMTLWNTYSFFVTYANIDRFDPTQTPRPELTADLDRWIISRLNRLISAVDESLASYNPTDATRAIQEFVDDLSNWYVRRSRRRFWKSENDADKLSAHHTLYECLVTLAKLLAPFTPFVAEEMYQNLVRSGDESAPESVHLADFPVADLSLVDENLEGETGLVIRLSSLGRAARSKAAIKVRQPLPRLLAKTRSTAEALAMERLAPQLMDELNVKGITLLEDETEVLEYSIRPRFDLLGPKYGSDLGKIAKALAGLEVRTVASAVRDGRTVEVSGIALLPEEIEVSSQEKAGFCVASEGGYTVAFDTRITQELADEGLARELVHRIQTMRRSAGFDIADHIVLYYQGSEAIDRVMEGFSEYIRQETLAHKLLAGPAPEDAYTEALKVDGQAVTLGVKKTR